MIKTAQDRFETEDMNQPFAPHDFMPDVLEIISKHGNDFNTEQAQTDLNTYFQNMIDDCKKQHHERTPKPAKENNKDLKK